MFVTSDYLDQNPDAIFVFGDNTIRKGLGGAARLRHHPQAYGFITKKYPNNRTESFYTQAEYRDVFERECSLLVAEIEANPQKRFLISEIGGGLANKHGIYEAIIQPWRAELAQTYPNVELV